MLVDLSRCLGAKQRWEYTEWHDKTPRCDVLFDYHWMSTFAPKSGPRCCSNPESIYRDLGLSSMFFR